MQKQWKSEITVSVISKVSLIAITQQDMCLIMQRAGFNGLGAAENTLMLLVDNVWLGWAYWWVGGVWSLLGRRSTFDILIY